VMIKQSHPGDEEHESYPLAAGKVFSEDQNPTRNQDEWRELKENLRRPGRNESQAK